MPTDTPPSDPDLDRYRYHLVHELNTMLAEYQLRDEWLGMVAGPQLDDTDDQIALVYNVRAVDGPHKRKFAADLVYSWDASVGVDRVRDVYRAQLEAVTDAFPEIDVQDYDEWDV